jgi:hypothetical protein
MSANQPQTLRDGYSRATKLLDAEYKPGTLDDIIKKCENLHVEEQHQLKELLQKYMSICLMENQKNSTWNIEPISLQLMNTNCKLIHAYANAYTVPGSVEYQLQPSKEIVRLVDIGILEEDYSSEWASTFSSFAISKKNGTIRVVTDFRKINVLLNEEYNPFTIPKLRDMIGSMEGSTFVSALDLHMGYYHIKLDADAQKLCTIVFP